MSPWRVRDLTSRKSLMFCPSSSTDSLELPKTTTSPDRSAPSADRTALKLSGQISITTLLIKTLKRVITRFYTLAHLGMRQKCLIRDVFQHVAYGNTHLASFFFSNFWTVHSKYFHNISIRFVVKIFESSFANLADICMTAAPIGTLEKSDRPF